MDKVETIERRAQERRDKMYQLDLSMIVDEGEPNLESIIAQRETEGIIPTTEGYENGNEEIHSTLSSADRTLKLGQNTEITRSSK